MGKVLVELVSEVKGNLLNIAGLATAIGQFAFLGELLKDGTATATIFLVCLALFCGMCFLSVHSFLKAKGLSRYSRKRQLYKILCLFYTILALLALYPAGYRWMYIYTDWLPSDQKPREVEIGGLFSQFPGEARASALERPLEINMYLDPLRTSLQCSKTRNNQKEKEETFNVDECAEYSIPASRLHQIMNGHGIDESGAQKDEFDQLYSKTMRTAFEALETISNYRGKHASLLDRGPKIMFLVSQKPSWQKKLLDANLLPDANEWERLTKEHPDMALALRKFIIEWIGFLDPFFHISFRNTTSKPIEISGIQYTATPRREFIQATVFGAYDKPRYLVELEEGKHEIEVLPPIEVPSNGIGEIDILLRLKKPDPGVTYDFKLEFLSRKPAYRVTLPRFAVTFMRDH